MKQCFIAVATGQNVANLPPILQFAESGDLVIWLESEWARRNGWVLGSVEVLAERGIDSRRYLVQGDVNRPATVDDVVRRSIEERKESIRKVYVVLNGGQKLTPFGLALGVRPWRDTEGGEITFLYGEDRPARLRLFEQRIGNGRECTLERERMLECAEVLRVSGRGMENVTSVWRPGGDGPGVEPYGADMELTRMVHAHEAARRARQRLPGAPWEGGYDAWGRESKKRWRRRLREILEAVGVRNLTAGSMEEVARRFAATARGFEPGLPAYRIPREKREHLDEHGWLMGTGTRFERAVFLRVCALLAARPDLAAAVREVVWGGDVRVGTGTVAEFDVAIVLLNGIVIHLECKFGGADRKDLHAREFNLARAASQLSRMYVVAPFFPEFSDEPWFSGHHISWIHLAAHSSSLIAYTSFDPPRSFVAPNPQNGADEEYEGPVSFESSLERILSPYAEGVPAPGAAGGE